MTIPVRPLKDAELSSQPITRSPFSNFRLDTGTLLGEYKAKVYHVSVDEGRKRVLLIAASILAARKLSQYESGTRIPATVGVIAHSIRWAEEIMREIDRRWPEAKAGH
jgi:hypothetical protein